VNFYGKATEAAEAIVKAFQDPQLLPKPLANIFIRRLDDVPCRKWSWRNQLLMALQGYSDARGFRQWQEVSRHVRSGERAIYIMAPITRKGRDDKTGEQKVIVVGFKGVPVFGYEQTEGAPLPATDPDADKWVKALPLAEVARKWGIKVEAVDGQSAPFLGSYRHTTILLAVRNLSTFAHELVHASDDRLGALVERGQQWPSETVAELGAAILLRLLGYEEEADLGGAWRYIQRYADAAGIEVVDACGRVLDRTCQAVGAILDAAENIQQETMLLFARG
jgi:antirestriction protein ArdC